MVACRPSPVFQFEFSVMISNILSEMKEKIFGNDNRQVFKIFDNAMQPKIHARKYMEVTASEYVVIDDDVSFHENYLSKCIGIS